MNPGDRVIVDFKGHARHGHKATVTRIDADLIHEGFSLGPIVGMRFADGSGLALPPHQVRVVAIAEPMPLFEAAE